MKYHCIHHESYHTFDEYTECSGWIYYQAQDQIRYGCNKKLLAESKEEANEKWIIETEKGIEKLRTELNRRISRLKTFKQNLDTSS